MNTSGTHCGYYKQGKQLLRSLCGGHLLELCILPC
jgi:hypothetical protein